MWNTFRISEKFKFDSENCWNLFNFDINQTKILCLFISRCRIAIENCCVFSGWPRREGKGCGKNFFSISLPSWGKGNFFGGFPFPHVGREEIVFPFPFPTVTLCVFCVKHDSICRKNYRKICKRCEISHTSCKSIYT